MIILLTLAFVAGVWACKPLAQLQSPPSIPTLVALLSPGLFLYFFSEIEWVNTIRYLYYSLLAGMFCYWTYFETKKKMHE